MAMFDGGDSVAEGIEFAKRINALSKPTEARIREIVKKIEAAIKKSHEFPECEEREFLGLSEFDVIEAVLKKELL